MSTHTIYFPDLRPKGEPMPPGSLVTIDGEEAHHAWRVKRLDVGHLVRLVDARGAWSDATIARLSKRGRDWAIEASLGQTHLAPPATPIVHALVAPPKGDRLADMIDQLSQVGAASWTPLLCQRTIVEPREAKIERLHRIAIEAMKQCGRTHALAINPPIKIMDFLRSSPAHAIIADASGAPLRAMPGVAARAPEANASPHDIHLLIGPEGGFTPAELDAARAHAVHVASLGVHTMRIETAAVVGVGLLMARQ